MDKRLRIIPLGGIEEVGENCTVLEYDHEIIVIDFGFDFPGPDLPGIDYILPDITYLKENKKKIKGLVITHGHLDHIGAIDYLLPELNNPPILATPLTMGLIKDRLTEKNFNIKELNLKIIKPDQEFSLGIFKINPFQVVHNIPDSVGLVVETAMGKVVHTGDFKIDQAPVDQKPLPKKRLKSLGKQGILALLSDSTNANLPGHSVPEKEVGKIIDQIIKEAPQRIIFTTFSTLVSRIQQVIYACHQHKRKIALVGMSMQKSVSLAQKLGYLKTFPGIFIDVKEIDNYANKKILILAAGAQGVEGSSMDRISDNEHRLVKIRKGDTVVFSSSTIPGNELAIHEMMDGLVNQGANIIYRAVLGSGVHSSGHAFQEELKEMINLVKPKIFIPVEGRAYMHASHIKLAQEQGVQLENCFLMHRGEILEIDSQKNGKILNKRVSHKIVVVEGGKINSLEENIIKSRHQMAEAGICFVTFFRKNINLNFKGMLVEKGLPEEIKKKAQKLINKYQQSKKKKFYQKIERSLSDFILSKTGKKPLVVISFS